ncbi:MAG: transglutaminase-like domain-containing protein [Verrucomicrobiota bacterium]
MSTLSSQQTHINISSDESRPWQEYTEFRHQTGNALVKKAYELASSRSEVPRNQSSAPRYYSTELIETQNLLETLSHLDCSQLSEQSHSCLLLYNQLHSLKEAHLKLSTHFQDIRAQLAGHPDAEVFLARHDEAVSEHESCHQSLLTKLKSLETNFADHGKRASAILELADWFTANPAHARTPIGLNEDNNKSYHRTPVENRKELAEMGINPNGIPEDPPSQELQPFADPVPADTAETLEVAFTTEITTLATELNNSPLEIFNYVKQNIIFDPYVGSRRGAAETLRLKAGNDTDQASLLIALLRVSGIPARYAQGRVRMSPDSVNNWIGTQNAAAAGSVLATAGMGGTTIFDGQDINAVECQRVWVEAYVPYSNYRGSEDADGEALWIPLDPAFKQYDNDFGIDFLSITPNFNASTFITDYVSSGNPDTVVSDFLNEVSNYLGPSTTATANALQRSISEPTFDWLPGSLPNTLISRDGHYSEIPDTDRFKVRFLLSGQGSTLDHTVSLPQIAGRQLTLSYRGQTTADRNAISAAGGLFGINTPWTIKVTPELKLDGCIIATGTGGITLGVRQDSQFFFTNPGSSGSTDSISNTIVAGDYQGLAIDTGRALSPEVDRVLDCSEDFTGGFQHELGIKYLELNDLADRQVASVMQGVLWKGVSNAILGQQLGVAYSGSTPLTFDYNGLYVDADRASATFFSASNADRRFPFGRIRGAQSSQNENLVFEINLAKESVSTIKILSLASAVNIPILEITPANSSSLLNQLNQPASVVNSIISELNSGKNIVIPRDPILYFDWGGTGYINYDPVNGTGGYIISGGISGGATADEEDEEPGCDRAETPVITPASPGNIYSECQIEPVEIEVPITTFDAECNAIGFRMEKRTVNPQTVGVGVHTFEFGSFGDCGCVARKVTITIEKSPVSFTDSGGRVAVGGLLEIAAKGSEDITARVDNGPANTQWAGSNGASPPSQTGPVVVFNVDIPNSIPVLPNALVPIPALAWMLFPPSPACIEVTNLPDICNEKGNIYPFPADKFTFSVKLGQGAQDAKNNLKELQDIIEWVETIEDQLEALDVMADRLQSPVKPPKPKFSASFSLSDFIKEDKDHRVIYSFDIGVNGDFGISWDAPLGSTAFLGIPPQLANASIFVPIEGKIGGRVSGIAEFKRGGGWLNTAFPQATIFAGIRVGLGVRASLASGFISITGRGTTAITARSNFFPTVMGNTLNLGGDLQASIGGLTFDYSIGAVWGLWTTQDSWVVFNSFNFPSTPKPFTVLSFNLP